MKKIIFLQNEIMHYRKPVYNLLSDYYDVTVLHSGKKSWELNDRYNELIVNKFKFGPLYFQKNIFNKIRSNEYDVVVVMADLHWINNFLILFSNSRAKYITWGHRYSANFLVNMVRNIWLKYADANILYSDIELQRIINAGIPKEKFFIAENTIHVPNHQSGTHHKKVSFLFVGRAQKRKKVDELILAFHQLQDKLPNETLLEIVGDGEENVYLSQLADSLGIGDKVIFHGSITHPDKLREIFHRSYAYISPGPVGLGVLHSLAYGVPVITYRDEYHGPEFDNLIDSENAFIVNDFEELKSAMLQVIESATYITMGDTAYKLYQQERTIEYMVKGFINAIEYVD